MVDVWTSLGIKSLPWKIEKRVLERIGHVIRMENSRITKAFVLSWYEGLEGTNKMRGRKRKTVLYWRKLIREAGWDHTDIERLTIERKGWKTMRLRRV